MSSTKKSVRALSTTPSQLSLVNSVQSEPVSRSIEKTKYYKKKVSTDKDSVKDSCHEKDGLEDLGVVSAQSGGDTQTINSTTTDEDEANRKNIHSNYQALPLLKQRFGYLWDNKMFTDVVIMVGQSKQIVEAHRIILASASKIFQELLYQAKPLVSDEKFVLHELDFPVAPFKVFLKAMYTNEIPICLSLSMALEVYYATRKYEVRFLQDQILTHIRLAVGVANVFEALKVSTHTMELTSMIPICWKIIEEQTREVLEHHIESLNQYTFTRVLEREYLNIEEAELFQFMVKWAFVQCKRRGLKTTGRNKRIVVEPILKHIRFTTMGQNAFNEIVVPARILDANEICTILSHMNTNIQKTTIPYNIRMRYKPNPVRRRDSFVHTTRDDLTMNTMASDSAIIAHHNLTKLRLRKTSQKLLSKRLSTPTTVVRRSSIITIRSQLNITPKLK